MFFQNNSDSDVQVSIAASKTTLITGYPECVYIYIYINTHTQIFI